MKDWNYELEQYASKIDEYIKNDIKEYFEEVEIAEQTLEKQKLNNCVKGAKLVCDVYCIPSHNHQAFFFKLFKTKKEYIILYAKTFIANCQGFRVAMYKFKDCIRAQNHFASVGEIICGIKRLPKDNMIIKELVDSLPTKNEWLKKIIIDGVSTVIRNYLPKETKLLSYSLEAQFVENNYSEAQKRFLDNLFLHIEDVIGNVLDYK